MTIRNLPPVMEGPDFEEQVASIRANRTFYMPRRGPDGFYSLLIYRPKSPRIITGGSEAEVRRELNAGADVVVSLRTRSVYISPMLRPTPDREIRYCGCAPDSRECQCPRMDMGAPPANGRMIDDDHPEMQKNIAAERCTAGGARSTAESNYQRVMGNHGWRNENPEPTEIAPGEELVLGEGTEMPRLRGSHDQKDPDRTGRQDPGRVLHSGGDQRDRLLDRGPLGGAAALQRRPAQALDRKTATRIRVLRRATTKARRKRDETAGTTTGSGPHGKRTGMGTFRITLEWR